MANPSANSKDADTSTRAKYEIGDNIGFINLQGSQYAYDTRSTDLYSNRQNLRSKKVGYTILSCVDYNTQNSCACFYLPLPESMVAPVDYNWSDQSEEALDEFASAALENHGDQHSNIPAANQSVARFLAQRGSEVPGVKGALRAAGLAYNPNQQMYFGGVTFSTATYTFKLAPSSALEATVMYEAAKCIMHMSAPGSTTAGVGDLIAKLGGIAMDFLAPKQEGGDAAAAQARQQEAANQIKKLQGTINRNENGFIENERNAFFTYPPLWDISFHVPTKAGNFIPVMEWKRLCCESCRLEYGSDVKWHADGKPVSVNMTLQLKETVLKTAATFGKVMPTIIP